MLNLLINSLMKKQLFLVVVAALAMASCSKDESTGINNGNAIDFRAAMQTRASETTMANITNFFVTALDKNNANYFSDAEFTKDGAFFTSTPAYYWPSDGSNLSFFAYSPSAADLDATVTINSTTKTLADFEPATTIADQKDFITATATGSKTDEAAGVALTFGHRLSQIEIKAKNTNDGYVYKVQGVRIGQPVSKATFDFGTTSWQLGSVKTNYEATYAGSEKTLTGTAASIMAVEDDNAMLIPQQLIAWTPDTDKTNTNKGAYLAVKVNITTKDGARVYPSVGEYDWVAVAVNTKWDVGRFDRGRLYGRPDFDTTNFNRLYRRQPMADGQNRHLPDFDVEHRNHSDFYRDGSGRFYLCRRQRKLFGDQLCRRFPSGRCYANRSGGLDRRICRG